MLNGRAGDLVEDHALDGDLGLEDLQQVPGDGFPLAILIGCEIQLVRIGQQRFQPADHIFLRRMHLIGGREVVIDIDRQTLGWQVADVPNR